MIISCHECLKRYLIDPVSLGLKGRVVRCSSCGHSWHQNPPEDMPKILEPTSSSFKSTSDLQENVHLSASFSETMTAQPQSFEQTSYEPLTTRISPTSSKSTFSRFFLGLLLGLVVLGFLSFLYFGRFYIVKIWPSSTEIYETFGIKTNSLAQFLELEDVSWTPGVDENQNPIFILKGYILNTSHKALAIPPLTIAFVSNVPEEKNSQKKCSQEGCIIDRWIAHTSSDRILPGEIYPFQITLNKKIPQNATNLYVEFIRP
ncbi:MAG: zinc-ribbon domain-containing protein [Proteobacteria bacterium]|nr:zinc-ribbon domain-containing protein [Pseudomonadota bacterium]